MKKNQDDFDRLVAEIQREITEQEQAIYSARVIEEVYNPKNVGRMPHPDAHGIVHGWCGDTMEISAAEWREHRASQFCDRRLRAIGGLWKYAHHDGDGDFTRK